MKLVGFAALMLAATPVAALAAQPAGKSDVEQPVTKAQIDAKLDADFADMDANHDGKVDAAEIDARLLKSAEAKLELIKKERDAAYAAVAAFGFVAFAAMLASIAKPVAIVGGLFLLWLGVKYFRTDPEARADPASGGDLAKLVTTTFLLTIGNPATILTAAALFAGLGYANGLDRVSATVLVAGVFAGSMAWWIILSAGVSAARRKLPSSFALWVNRISGVLIAGFGLLSLASAFLG
jgi:putative LysE/RhtB family amino acid efflux pump